MKYSLQQLDKAAIIINQIKELDAAIIALDSLAIKVSEHNIDYTLKVSGDIKKDTTKESVLDADGSLKKEGEDPYNMFSMFSFGRRSTSTTPNNTLVEVTIKDVEILGILGMLIKTKYEQREFLKNQIRKLGIEI